MLDLLTQFCRSAVAGKTNPKVKTGTAALGSVRDWCHNYDLTKSTPLQDLGHSRPVRQAANPSVSVPIVTAFAVLVALPLVDSACRIDQPGLLPVGSGGTCDPQVSA